ncbi:nuclear transport factor 2 family protein [Lactobacillus sp. Sy-1]|uniref:nuclear transport factor 2 family protein n=1 Tax=Lactobacillus sp. Sy-1 TaxID=2109645 RepID=UPI001C5AF4DA|nr:nuclear transport factor 2 family protein [Lactobacillus sp. Sy-1]MBW1606141.1 nuclear transport factor 2 family protein [Lactobacillus sp. Sy-1]
MTINIQEISDRIELKQLVDQLSNYADTKENEKQVQLFTEAGKVNIINNEGKVTFQLSGRDEILNAFAKSMAGFKSVFHMSGQQTVEFIDDHHARGVAYNYVVLTKEEADELITTQEGVRYDDYYVKESDKWLIDTRNSHFIWRK